MTSIIFLTTVALIVMLAELGWAQPSGLTCDQLDKVVPPGISAFISNNPFEFSYVLTKTFDCTARVYVQPVHGLTNYSGTALDIRGTHIIINDFTIGSDSMTAFLTNCDNGKKQVWHFQYIDLNDPQGANYCAYSCNGPEIVEYKCTTNTGYISATQRQAVKKAQLVPNGYKIHLAQDNCPPHPFCPLYY
uniref:Hydroxynitrile lyase n=1 Tax=Parafontaria falcifera TaxID=690633 RepID=A0A2Z5XCT3_9MYRI|nr:hydroxynitrile lyase [Parafontaria falcifera]